MKKEFYDDFTFPDIFSLFITSMFIVADMCILGVAIGGIGIEKIDYYFGLLRRVIIAEGLSPILLAFLLMEVLFFAKQFYFSSKEKSIRSKILIEFKKCLNKYDIDNISIFDGVSTDEIYRFANDNVTSDPVLLKDYCDIEEKTESLADEDLISSLCTVTQFKIGDKLNKQCRDICADMNINAGEEFIENMQNKAVLAVTLDSVKKCI